MQVSKSLMGLLNNLESIIIKAMRKARILKEGSAKGKIVEVGRLDGMMYYCKFPKSERYYKFWKHHLEFLNV